MNKGWMIAIIIVVVLLLVCGGLCGGGVFLFFETMKKLGAPVDAVLNKVASGDSAGAYQAMSPEYRARKSEAEFIEDMKKEKLNEYQASQWTSFQMKSTNANGTATLVGAITLKSGGSVVVTATMSSADGGKTWLVDDINNSAGAGGPPKTTEERKPREMKPGEVKQ